MGDTTPGSQAGVEELRAQVAELTERLAELERRMDTFHPAGEVPGDVLLAISAACAAYLGHRAKVKHVHMHRQSQWTRQGRSMVQNSHVVR